MSDTPRTDAVYFKQGATMYDLANEMKLVEHELNAAKSKIELLMSANADVARIAGERDAAEKRIKRLEAVVNDPHALWANWLRGDVKLPEGIGDVRQYQDRIKRLHEAGDEMIWAFCTVSSASMMTEREADALKLWNEAKEAKP